MKNYSNSNVSEKLGKSSTSAKSTSVKGSDALFETETGFKKDDQASVLITQGRDPSEAGRRVISSCFY